jgi:hypothetical protein
VNGDGNVGFFGFSGDGGGAHRFSLDVWGNAPHLR